MALKEKLKEQVRVLARKLYWRVNAFDGDNVAEELIIRAEVPHDSDSDLVVAELDRVASKRGASINRILRAKTRYAGRG